MNQSYSDYPTRSSEDMEYLLAYVYGALSEAETAELTREISQNIGLRMTVNGMIQVKETKGFVTGKEHLEWLDRRRKTVDNVFQHHQRTRRNQIFKTVIAFATVVLICMYLFNLPIFSSPKLYKKYQAKPEIASAKMDQWPVQNLANFTAFYGANQYLQVLEECNRMLSIDSSLTDVRLYAGFCYLELNDFEKAMDQFSRIILTASDEHLRTQAIWQTGLAYIKIKDFDHAIQAFDSLATEQNIVPEDARLVKKARKILWRAKVRNFVVRNIAHRV
ncbi:MAG: hypothetical protein SF052_11465 [Bacteroidia bacterium]|nr:hypothetical protein [Bacteroidia bacterium]